MRCSHDGVYEFIRRYDELNHFNLHDEMIEMIEIKKIKNKSGDFRESMEADETIERLIDFDDFVGRNEAGVCTERKDDFDIIRDIRESLRDIDEGLRDIEKNRICEGIRDIEEGIRDIEKGLNDIIRVLNEIFK